MPETTAIVKEEDAAPVDGPWTNGFVGKQWANKHHHDMADVTFSIDGQVVASAGCDNKMRLWSKDGVYKRTCEGHTKWIIAVDVLPHDTAPCDDVEDQFVTISWDETIRRWNQDGVLVGAARRALGGENGSNPMPYCMAVSPDGMCVAYGCNDGKMRIADIDAVYTPRAMLLGHKQAVCCVGWSPDGMHVVAGSNDCTARTWKLGQLEYGPDVEMRLLQQEMHRLDGHDKLVCGAAWRPEHQGTPADWIATCATDATIRIWHARNGRVVHKMLIPKAAPEPKKKGRFDDSSDDSDSDDDDPKKQQMKDRALSKVSARSVAWSTDGRSLVSGHNDGSLIVWGNWNEPRMLKKYNHIHAQSIVGLAVSCENLVATVSMDQCVGMWVPKDGATAPIPRIKMEAPATATTPTIKSAADDAKAVAGVTERVAAATVTAPVSKEAALEKAVGAAVDNLLDID